MKSGHVMPAFSHYFMVLGSICDTECSVHFHKCTVTIYESQGLLLLQGWQDNKFPKLWRFSLRPQISTPSSTKEVGQAFTVVPNPGVKSSDFQYFSTYVLPSVESLVQYLYAASGSPVKSTWLDSIRVVNFVSWPGLTYQNESNYCPSSDKTIKCHMAQTRQNVRSTIPKLAP